MVAVADTAAVVICSVTSWCTQILSIVTLYRSGDLAMSWLGDFLRQYITTGLLR
jgi:hypothetical protein